MSCIGPRMQVDGRDLSPEPVPKFVTWFQIRLLNTRFSAVIVQNNATNFWLVFGVCIRQFQIVF